MTSFGSDRNESQPAFLLGRLFADICELDRLARGVDRDLPGGVFARRFDPCTRDPRSTLALLRDEVPDLLGRARERDAAGADRIHGRIATAATVARLTVARLTVAPGADPDAESRLFVDGYHDRVSPVRRVADTQGTVTPIRVDRGMPERPGMVEWLGPARRDPGPP